MMRSSIISTFQQIRLGRTKWAEHVARMRTKCCVEETVRKTRSKWEVNMGWNL
jgi:hypothetical protein